MSSTFLSTINPKLHFYYPDGTGILFLFFFIAQQQ